MTTAAEYMRDLWRKFGPTMTKGTVHVDGFTRPMTQEEMRLSDEAFGAMDEIWAKSNKVFDEARRENARRKVKP